VRETVTGDSVIMIIVAQKRTMRLIVHKSEQALLYSGPPC
jgi:hypothetical protein